MAYSKAKISISNVTGNIVITATATPSVTPIINILDTIGYQDGYRCKTSSYEVGTASGYTVLGSTSAYDCTNLSSTDILRIYIPNGLPSSQDSNVVVQVNNTSLTSFAGLYIYEGSLSVFGNIFGSYTYDSSTKIITLTNHNSSASKQVFRLSVAGSGADCIMTLNQEIT